jgi:hypothetical protein
VLRLDGHDYSPAVLATNRAAAARWPSYQAAAYASTYADDSQPEPPPALVEPRRVQRLGRSRKGLWFCPRDIPPHRIRRALCFAELAGTR